MIKLQSWLDRGDWLTVHNRRVFVVDSGGDKPVLCLLHGFPTSGFDYFDALPFLTQHFRVVVHDHLGFGASDKPNDYSYSLIEQTDCALALWKKLGIQQCFVFAHDYGTSVATEMMVRQLQESLYLDIEGYIFSNGSVHIELSKLRPIQKLLRMPFVGPCVARLSNFSTFRRNMQKLFVDQSVLTDEVLAAHWSLLTREKGKSVLPKVSRYTLERQLFWHRWVGALCSISRPVDLVWGRNDIVAIPAIAESIHNECQSSRLKWIEECGHFPMIEKAEEWSESIIQQVELRRQIQHGS